MKLDNKGKAYLLGEPIGTASNKLRKQILYEFAGILELLECYRCGLKIETIKEFSIEHKNAWSKALNPVESFYSMNNISFSHMSCNAGAANKENFKKYETSIEKSREAYRRLKNNPERYETFLEYKRNWYKKNKPL